MRDFLRDLVYSDKIFDNPVLGKVSCGAFNETLISCKQHSRRDRSLNPCLELKQLTSHCYSSKSSEELNRYIMNEFEESLILQKFL